MELYKETFQPFVKRQDCSGLLAWPVLVSYLMRTGSKTNGICRGCPIAQRSLKNYEYMNYGRNCFGDSTISENHGTKKLQWPNPIKKKKETRKPIRSIAMTCSK